VARGAIEEEGNRGVENRCDRLQAAGAYAIRPLLILLNLLKSYAQALAQLFLADAKHIPAQPDSASDVNVDRIRPLLAVVHRSLAARDIVTIRYRRESRPLLAGTAPQHLRA